MQQYEGRRKGRSGQIDNARLQLVYCRITAPISGRVGLRLVDPGNIVHAADANGLIVITQFEPITVSSPIPEDNLPQLQQQMRAGRRLTVEAYDRDLKHKLATGSLLTIDNQIDPTTGTVKLKALFPKRGQCALPQPVRQRPSAWSTRCATLSWFPTRRCSAARNRRSSTSSSRTTRSRRETSKSKEARATRRQSRAASRQARSSSPTASTSCSRERRWLCAGRNTAVSLNSDNHEPLSAVHPAADRDVAADGGSAARGRGRLSSSCRSPRCRRSTIRPSRSSPSIRAPAPT